MSGLNRDSNTMSKEARDYLNDKYLEYKRWCQAAQQIPIKFNEFYTMNLDDMNKLIKATKRKARGMK